MKRLIYLTAIAGFVMVSCTKPEPIEEPTYSFEIGAEKGNDSTDETRVEYVDGLMHWSVGDQVQMHIKNAGSAGSPLEDLYGIPMTGLHREPTRATTFAGELSQTEMSRLNPNNRYDYVTSYSGKGSSISTLYGVLETKYIYTNRSTTISIFYNMPDVLLVKKNEFSPKNVIMIATAFNVPPMTWLENNTQKFGERMTFTYKHIFAYLRIKIEENSSGKIIPRVTVGTQYKSGIPQQLYAVSGEMSYNIYKTIDETYIGIVRSASISSAITAACYGENGEGGIDAGDYIYVPIRPLTFHSTQVFGLQFNFYFDGSSTPVIKQIDLTANGSLEAGKIYDIAFKL